MTTNPASTQQLLHQQQLENNLQRWSGEAASHSTHGSEHLSWEGLRWVVLNGPWLSMLTSWSWRVPGLDHLKHQYQEGRGAALNAHHTLAAYPLAKNLKQHEPSGVRHLAKPYYPKENSVQYGMVLENTFLICICMDTEWNHHHHMAVSKRGNLVQNSVPRGRALYMRKNFNGHSTWKLVEQTKHCMFHWM